MNEFPPPTLPYSSGPPPGYPWLPQQRNSITVATVVAWLVIAASVVVLMGSNWLQSRQVPKEVQAGPGRVEMQTELMGRYAMGVRALSPTPAGKDPSQQLLVTQIEQGAKTREDKLGAVVVAGELLGKEAALSRLKTISSAAATQPANNSPPRKPDPLDEALEVVYAQGPEHLSTDQRAMLTDRLGWLGQAAETFGKTNDDPARAKVHSAALRTVIVMVGALVIVGLGIFAGLVLLILFLVALADRKLPMQYRRAGAADVYLEAFAVYLGGMTASAFIAPHLPGILHSNLGAHIGLMLCPTLLAFAWPALRGEKGPVWRAALGWHTGRGVFREIGCGLAGYIAGLPVVAVGFGITWVLISRSGATPSHPIQQMLGGNGKVLLLAFLLASVYAPLVEETMFRGAFFHALRGRLGWLLSATISSFIFAAIHPQGWTTIPTLMAIAYVFAGIREWRGTIISSAAAHCFHNSAALAFAILMLR